jgi:hypothetical protein
LKRYLLCWFFTLGLVTASFGQAVQTWQYANITLAAPTTTILKTSPGVLHNVCVNAPASTGTITIYDNVAGSGNKIGTITTPASAPLRCFAYDVAFWTGLVIVTATAAQDITVSFK